MTDATRREFLACCVGSILVPALEASSDAEQESVIVNDVQTQMNATRVARVIPIHGAADVQKAIQESKSSGRAIAIAGGRHASGGQQFGTGELLLDMSTWKGVTDFDRDNGLITVNGGTEWPELMAYYLDVQAGQPLQWGIAQKQGGLDRLTIGGALSANAHGHTLTLPPIANDIESFELIDCNGEIQKCSRATNSELFRCAIGGYGMFGVISSVVLRLIPRRTLRRKVAWVDAADAVGTLEKRASEGSPYGDFQYSIDEKSDEFLNRGILTTYDQTEDPSPVSNEPRQLSAKDLEALLTLAHTDRAKAFRAYADATLASTGELVWSDTHQNSPYPAGYHRRIDTAIHSKFHGSDPLMEMYVPRTELPSFLKEARRILLDRNAQVVYGTVRLIRRDADTFLAWAKQDYACVIFTLHAELTKEGISKVSDTFRSLISAAVAQGGSYYLTYNRFPDRKLLEVAYPQFPAFLRLKKKYDPHEIFQSTWYRSYKNAGT